MLLVDFLTAVNTLLPFDTLSRQGTPQLFHSTALLPALNKLQQVFSVPGNLTQRATLKQLRKRVRHHTSQLEWNAPLGGYILRAGSFTPAFRFEGPTLTWKQFWRAVGCVLDGQDGVLERVEAYPDGQGFRLIMTSEVQQAPVRVEGSRMEMLGRTMSLFATEPWRLSPVQFKDFSTLVSLPDVGLDATNAHDRRLMIAHGEWYLKRTSVNLGEDEDVSMFGQSLGLPSSFTLAQLFGTLSHHNADLRSWLASDDRSLDYIGLPGLEQVVESDESEDESQNTSVASDACESEDDNELQARVLRAADVRRFEQELVAAEAAEAAEARTTVPSSPTDSVRSDGELVAISEGDEDDYSVQSIPSLRRSSSDSSATSSVAPVADLPPSPWNSPPPRNVESDEQVLTDDQKWSLLRARIQVMARGWPSLYVPKEADKAKISLPALTKYYEELKGRIASEGSEERLSLSAWNVPPPPRDDVIATGRGVESLLGFFNPNYRIDLGNALRDPDQVSQANKDEIARHLGGNPGLQHIAREVERRLNCSLVLKSPAILTVIRDGVEQSTHIEPSCTYLQALALLFRGSPLYKGHSMSFSGDELRFTFW